MMLVQESRWYKVDETLPEVVAGLGASDAFIIGANVIDAHGGAALLAGASLGGRPGSIFTSIMAEGVPVVVAAGLEKLIPGTVGEAVRVAGRKGIDLAMGMAVGLMPIYGRIVTEVEAVKALSPVECHVIAKGGVDGAEGGISLMVSGEKPDVERIFKLALQLKGASLSGAPQSLEQCDSASARCAGHLACIYRSPKLLKKLAP